MTVKHATAGAFVFGRLSSGWRLGLIDHPRLDLKTIMGGHVEQNETQEEAVLREITEESGLAVRLIDPPMPRLPANYPHPRVAQPWWINEMSASADNHLDVPHVHVDHQYVAIADEPTVKSDAAHVFGWYREDDLAELPVFEDTRLLARVLFPYIHQSAFRSIHDNA